jgi:O-acetylserine/cysteine efflux transporter
MNPKHALLALLVTMLWGVNFVALKYGVAALPPFTVTLVRFAIVALLLSPWIFRVPKELFWHMLGLSFVMGVLYFGSLFSGLKGVPSGEACVLVQVEVPLAALLSSWLLKEKIKLTTWLAIFISIIGVIVTVGMPQRLGDLTSIGLLMLAAIFWAINTLQMKKVSSLHPFTINGCVCLMAVPQLLILSMIFEPSGLHSIKSAPITGWAAITYMALISTVLCYSLWFYLLRKYSVAKVTPFYLVSPVAALITSNLVMGEKLAIHTLVGTIILLTGLALVVIKRDETSSSNSSNSSNSSDSSDSSDS